MSMKVLHPMMYSGKKWNDNDLLPVLYQKLEVMVSLVLGRVSQWIL